MTAQANVTQETLDQIKDMIDSEDVVLFLKGNQQFPMCGFSSTVVQILKHLGVHFKDVDVLQDFALREGIKQYTDWPTIPQLYVDGEFIGGCDIVREMFESGELKSLLQEKGLINA